MQYQAQISLYSSLLGPMKAFSPSFVELLSQTSRERLKSVPYLRLKKTRKPLFLQLETTKALKKLKIEKKNPNFFRNFLKFPVSHIVPKNVKGGTLWDFLKIHSVAKYQKLMGGTIKKISEKNEKFEQSHSAQKRGKSHSVKKVERGDLLLWNGFLSHVRSFGCVQNEVLSTYGKGA